MTAQFFQRQLDYIIFFYGFAFILLAAICFVLRRERPQRLPWIWLELFGLTHGIAEWLEMLQISLAPGTALSAIRLGITALSFIFLFEFGRSGQIKLKGKGPGKWVYISLSVLVIPGGFMGLPELNAAVRYSFAFIGGLWSALNLFRASRIEKSTRRALFFAAVFMAAYALVAGVIVTRASFFPASAINHAAFLSLTGIPIQMVRGILAVLIATAFWGYYRIYRQSVLPIILPEITRKAKTHYGLQLSVAIVIVLICGWILTEFVGKAAEREDRNDILNQAGVAAAALNAERVGHLRDNVFDADDPDYVRLRKQLGDMNAENPQYRWLYLMSLRGRTILLLVYSSQERSGHIMPRREIYRQFPEELYDVFNSGKAAIAGPYTDENGTFVSGFAPVREPSGKIAGVLGIDINADYMQKEIAKRRSGAIFITLLISLLCAGFFIVRQRSWESAQMIEASEKILTEAQKMAHVGSWTYDPRKDEITWSEEMFKIFGLEPQGGAPSFSGQLRFIHEDDREKIDEAFKKSKREGQEYELEFRIIRPDGEIRHVVQKVNAIIGDTGVQMLGTCQDITERKKAEEQLRDLSLIDELTGLNNRRSFLILATQHIKIADRMKQGAVLVYADMDKLKWVNDTFGHKEGDMALIDIANILRNAFRASDIIGRLGGDEFVGLILESSEKAEEAILARLKENLNAHNLQGDRPYKLSVSFGLSRYDPENPRTLEELMESADRMMYEQKQKRKMQRTE